MNTVVTKQYQQVVESPKLDAVINRNLEVLGYGE